MQQWSRRLVTIAILAAVAGSQLPVGAQNPAAVRATKKPAGVPRKSQPGDVDLLTSRTYIYVGKTGLGHEHAVMGQIKSGTIHLGAKEAAGQVVFDIRSFVADSAEARKYIGLEGESSASTAQQVTANMLSPQVLDAGTYPTAEFSIARCLPLKEASKRGFPQYQLDGTFTLHGVANPIQVIAELDGERKSHVHLRGAFQILQTDYGMKPFTKAFGAVGVTNELTIWGDFWLLKDASVTAAGRVPPRK